MEQPKKEKKKPNGQVVSGTEDLKRRPEDIKSGKAFRKYVSKDSNRQKVEKKEGVTINPENKQTFIKEYEKTIQPATRPGQDTRVFDESGKEVARARYGSQDEQKLKRKYRISKQTTETSRQKKADLYNYQLKGEGQGNRVYDERMAQQQKDKDKKKK